MKMVQSDQTCCTVKETVREKYDAIARGERDCGCRMVDELAYQDTPGYQAQADLGLGCGTPVDYADLKPGEIVLDLGSGAGLDAMIAAPLVGEKGKVLGVDLAPSMVAHAKEIAIAVEIDNVFFQEGDIEDLPIQDASVDVVISNCTLNLVPDKEKAYSEIARVLRPGGSLHHLRCGDGRRPRSWTVKEGGGNCRLRCRSGRKRSLSGIDCTNRIHRAGNRTPPVSGNY